MNADRAWYGTVAEIGAGQETARWLFQVSGAAGTVAKTMSAYDMRFSDAIYGDTKRYVSRQRLQQMLDHEYGLLQQRLEGQRESTRFFAFANTVAARSRSNPGPGHGWLGIRFQLSPDDPPSDVVVHVQLHDVENVQQQAALGTAGLNLIYGAYALYDHPEALVDGLMNELGRDRLEVDMVRFDGPVAKGVDNRLLSVQLVAHGLTDAAMFTADGENVQPAESLYNQPVLIQRGSFRPITVPVMRMLEDARRAMKKRHWEIEEPVMLHEMNEPISELQDEGSLWDLIGRLEVLQQLGRNVLISNFDKHYRVAEMLRRYTRQPIGMVMGAPTLQAIFDSAWYTELGGGTMEALGRLFQHPLRFYVAHSAETDAANAVAAWRPNGPVGHLYDHLQAQDCVVPFALDPDADVSAFPEEVRRMIQEGESGWEELVPEAVAEAVRNRRLRLTPK